MVTFKAKAPTSEYGCTVIFSKKEPIEASGLQVVGCPIRVDKKDSLLTKPELRRGERISVNVFRVNELPSVVKRKKMISWGGKKAGSLEFKIKRENNIPEDSTMVSRDEGTVEVIHMKVDPEEQSEGLGDLLMRIIYAYAIANEGGKLKMTVGGGESTKGFFIYKGIPESDIRITDDTDLVKVDTHINDIEGAGDGIMISSD